MVTSFTIAKLFSASLLLAPAIQCGFSYVPSPPCTEYPKASPKIGGQAAEIYGPQYIFNPGHNGLEQDGMLHWYPDPKVKFLSGNEVIQSIEGQGLRIYGLQNQWMLYELTTWSQDYQVPTPHYYTMTKDDWRSCSLPLPLGHHVSGVTAYQLK